MLTSMFFMGNNITYEFPRSRFRFSHDWLKSCLGFARTSETLWETLVDEDEMEDAEERSWRSPGGCWVPYPKKILCTGPSRANGAIRSRPQVVKHLGRRQGYLTAIIDWECVSALPLWMTIRVPQFLWNLTREGKPKRDTYADETPAPSVASEKKAVPDELDNGGKNELYWIHLLEYDQTQLCKIYHDRLRSLWPEWDLQVAESRLEYNFYDAVVSCAIGSYLKAILEWVEGLEAGEVAELGIALRRIISQPMAPLAQHSLRTPGSSTQLFRTLESLQTGSL